MLKTYSINTTKYDPQCSQEDRSAKSRCRETYSNVSSNLSTVARGFSGSALAQEI
jgi:hypothetical protein